MLEELIVFDTNIYLDLYSYSKTAVEEILNSLEMYAFSKMYITQQIYDEFMKNYKRVRNNNLNYYGSQKKDFINKTNRITALISKLFSGRYDRFESNIRILCCEIEEFFSNKCNKINMEFDRLISEVSTSFDSDDTDLILQFVIKLYERSKPKGFTTLEKIKLSIEADQRAKLKLAPGYTDSNKMSLDSYGDFFIWKEVLLKGEFNQKIVLVQNETKTDWWEKKNGNLVPASILLEECPQLEMLNFLKFTQKYLLLNHNTFAEISEISTIFSYIMSTDDRNAFLCEELHDFLEKGLINYIKDCFEKNIIIDELSYEISLFVINDREFIDNNNIKCQLDIGIKFESQIIQFKNDRESYPYFTGECLCEITPMYSIEKFNINNPLKFEYLDNCCFSSGRKSKLDNN